MAVLTLPWLTCGGRPLGQRALGLVLIFVTAVIWVAASFLSSAIVSSRPGASSALHAPPLLLTYLATSVFTLFLPVVHGRRLLRRWLAGRGGGGGREAVEYSALRTAAGGGGIGGGGIGGGGIGGGGGGGLSALSSDDDVASRGSDGSGRLDSFGAALDAAVAEANGGGGPAAAAARGPASGPTAAAATTTSATAAGEREAALAAAQCFLLWFGAQLAFNVSLSMTSVTSNTILSSSSSLFTFALSMVFLKEPYTTAKLMSIAACIGGTVLVTLSDEMADGSPSTNVGGVGGGGLGGIGGGIPGGSNNSSSSSSSSIGLGGGGSSIGRGGHSSGGGGGAGHSVWGDLLCLGSAALYACYTIVLRRALPDDDEADVALFFGYVGLFCTLLFAPLVAGLALAGWMDVSRVTGEALAVIFLQGVLNYALSDYLWAHAVLLLGPTLATLGLSVQIPIAAAAEAAAGRADWAKGGATAAMTAGGTLLILSGFFAGNLAGGGEEVPGHHHRRSGGGGGGGAEDGELGIGGGVGGHGGGPGGSGPGAQRHHGRGGGGAADGSWGPGRLAAAGDASDGAGAGAGVSDHHHRKHHQSVAAVAGGAGASIELTSSAASSPIVPIAASAVLLDGGEPSSSSALWQQQQQQQQQTQM